MARRWSKRSFMPPFTMSVRAIAPNTRPPSATSNGVPPAFEISRTHTCSSAGCHCRDCWSTGRWPPERLCGSRAIEVHAGHSGLRGEWTKLAAWVERSRPAELEAFFCQDDNRPSFRSFVGQRGSCAASARYASSMPGAGKNCVAARFPKVIVPVLSSSSTSVPEASTARPDIAITLR